MSRFVLRTGWPRAVGEAWLLAFLLSAGLLSLYPDVPARLVQQGLLFIGAAAALWLALRWRQPTARRFAVLAQTLGVGLLFGVGVGWAFERTSDWLILQSPPDGPDAPNTLRLFVVLRQTSPLLGFLMFRIGVYLLVAWTRLQRRHLLWSIVQDHLLVAVGVPTLIVVPLIIYNVLTSATFNEAFGDISSPSASLAVTLVVGILPQLSLISILLLILMLVVLPLSAIASYLVARRTTRRLRALAAATTALRQGDYDARVPVIGEDEVAALQADFNAMAADLEANVLALQTEREKVATLLRSRRDLVVTVSHELRTPVTILRSTLERALGRHEDAAVYRDELGRMQAEVIRLQALIEDLFSLSRAEVDALELSLVKVDVAALSRQIVHAAAPLARETHHVEIITEIADLPLYASADPMRLEQVLRNLITNGVRHAAPGGVVAVRADATPTSVVLAVSDTGEGIAPEHLPQIWERYYHADIGGSGIGLALVKSLVEAMGGSVDVASRVGEGSTFTVTLPSEGPSAAHVDGVVHDS